MDCKYPHFHVDTLSRVATKQWRVEALLLLAICQLLGGIEIKLTQPAEALLVAQCLE